MIRAKAYDKAHVGDWVIVHSMDCDGHVERELEREGYYRVKCYTQDGGTYDLKYPDDFDYGAKPEYSFFCKMCGEKYYTYIDPSNFDCICDNCNPVKVDNFGMDREEEQTHESSAFDGTVA